MNNIELKHSSTQDIYQIFKERGMKADDFNYASHEHIQNPFSFSNVDKNINLLKKAYEGTGKILYIIDTDVDGITSASIFHNYFKTVYPQKKVGFKVNEGKRHGIFLDYPEIQELDDGDTLIVNDAGSNDIEKILFLLKKGITVIITDHHSIEEENLPLLKNMVNSYETFSIVSPEYDNLNSHMTGAGMAHKVIQAFDISENHSNSDYYYDLATLGIIADMESFDEEVLYYLSRGLEDLENKQLKSLVESNSYSIGDELTAEGISFFIAPNINAVFRVGTEEERQEMVTGFFSEICLNVPSTKRGAKEGDTEELHDKISRVMRNIKARQKRLVDKAIENSEILDDENIVIVKVEEKEKNFTGLIANKIANEYKRPALVVWFSEDELWKGSGRSYNDFDLKTFLENSDLTEFTAGHLQAFGCSFKEENVEKILKLPLPKINKKYLVEGIFDYSDLSVDKMKEICHYNKYFMKGFEAPMFYIKNIPVVSVNPLGQDFENMGVNIYAGDFNFLKFKGLTYNDIAKIETSSYVNALGKIKLNTYNGKTRLQFYCEEIESVGSLKPKYKFEF